MTVDAPASTRTAVPRRVAEPVARRLVTVAPHALAALVALVAALWTYRPWRFGRSVMVPSGDSLAFHAWVQNTVETGWYELGERVGAPFVQNNHGYAVTDELVMAAVGSVLAPLLGSAGAAVTAWVVLSFPLAAIAAVVLARHLRLGGAASVLVGVAFALLPDHFGRATGHYSLATTWVIPLGLLAAISVIHPPDGGARRRRWFEAAVLVGCVVVTLVNAYYAVFTGLLVAAAGLGAVVAARSWRPLVPTVSRGVALGLPLVVALGLDRLYRPSPFGYGAFDVTRSPADAEVYGGKISAMLLPSSAHRMTWFRELRQEYDATFPHPAEGPALGLVATLGFVGLVCWAILAYWRRGGPGDTRLGTLAGLTWVGLLVYVVGGLGTVWSMVLGGGGVRVWSRMHVFLALLALLALGLVLNRLRLRALRFAVAGLLVLVAVVDQTSPLYRSDPGAAHRVREETTGLTAAIAGRAGPDAMIYQYPQVTFPLQNRVTAPASAYDGFLPYLYSDDLRWSYGGLQGDPTADWQGSLDRRPLAEQAALLHAAGFAGVLVDRLALESTPQALADVRTTLGGPQEISSTGRWEYHDLGPDRAQCPDGADGDGATDTVRELADAATRPPLLYPGDGIETTAAGSFNTAGPAEVRVVTLRDGGWADVDVGFTIDSPAAALVVRLPDGTRRSLDPGINDVTWSGAVTRTETPITIERTDEGAGAYSVRGLTASGALSPSGERCLADLAADVRARS